MITTNEYYTTISNSILILIVVVKLLLVIIVVVVAVVLIIMITITIMMIVVVVVEVEVVVVLVGDLAGRVRPPRLKSSIKQHINTTYMSYDIHIHAPARKSFTNFQLYDFIIQMCSINWLGHGHGYECHSSIIRQLEKCRELPLSCPRDSLWRQASII